MPALPDVYYVPPWPEPGECGVVSFIREVARQVCAHAGPVARPVAVVGMASPDQRSGNPYRWTMVHLLLADGSHVVFTARPHPVVVADDEWRVQVNRHFVGDGGPAGVTCVNAWRRWPSGACASHRPRRRRGPTPAGRQAGGGTGERVPGGRWWASEPTGPGRRPVTVVRPRGAAGAPP